MFADSLPLFQAISIIDKRSMQEYDLRLGVSLSKRKNATMASHNGYLLIADISGYTAFLTSSEQDHANPILHSLLTSLVEQVGDPLHFWRMDGDAVLAYSTSEEFPSGDVFLTICENIYNAFATRQRDIITNTTCPCRACANVENLDLKIMAHYGNFEEMKFGPVTDISGSDVILVHRMAKTDVKAVTGIKSYALFSEAAVNAMDINAALTPYCQEIEHFGDVSMKVYDLGAAWEKFRARRERVYLEETDGVWTFRRHLNLPIKIVWDALVAPERKQRWMVNMKAVTVENPEGRIGPGSDYHCAHEMADFFYTVTDWEPFEYFSTRMSDPGREGISMPETYQLIETDSGTEVRYTMGQACDTKGTHSEVSNQEAIGFLSEFWAASFDEMAAQIDASE
ncbi:MAG: DUF2652 domain-containing protein [Rhodospirillales bacterium]|jgi:uncharacterized protein YndB with AHSA1/START domain|nr:DUF2652 domain-containing protein [Rhodospirillales bacterium]MBT6825176.1 DUF2652 domain-containing protein [Rhodospirillales bacterium]MBT7145267.1 DUF2652 domain-containing protein [Rhodospirillales bacterium]